MRLTPKRVAATVNTDGKGDTEPVAGNDKPEES
jgi:hypothetical protein